MFVAAGSLAACARLESSVPVRVVGRQSMQAQVVSADASLTATSPNVVGAARSVTSGGFFSPSGAPDAAGPAGTSSTSPVTNAPDIAAPPTTASTSPLALEPSPTTVSTVVPAVVALPGPSGATKPTVAQLPGLLVTPGALPIGWVVLSQEDGGQVGDLGTDCPANGEFALGAAPGAGLDISWEAAGSLVGYVALKLFPDRAGRDAALKLLGDRVAACVVASSVAAGPSPSRWGVRPGGGAPGVLAVEFESNDQREFHAEVQAFAAGDYVLAWLVVYGEPHKPVATFDALVAAQIAALAQAGR